MFETISNGDVIGKALSTIIYVNYLLFLDSAISTIKSSIFSETESGNEVFKRDLDVVMTPRERKYLEKALKIYQKNK